ncbi:restriction endonuclease subunit S [Bacillus mycoides]|uniref:restriction endonuclease subunit S n=1 Tax=Bacillus mycoides TaxID=1405 RepID=UPI003D24FFC0
MSNVEKTAIGLLPTNWEVRRIKDVCDTTSGGTPSRSKAEYYDLGTIPWIKTGELKHKYIFETKEKITEVALQQSSAKLVPKNSVLMAMYGATIGKTSINKIEATTNQACCAMIPKGKLEPEFLYYVLSSNKDKIVALGAGGAQPNISQQIIREIEIPFPPQEEQQKIVSILTSVDETIGKTETIIKQTEKVKKGLMQQLFTKGIGHTRFKKTDIGEIPEEWEVVALGDIAEFINGRGFKPHEWSDSGLPIIRIQNLNGGQEFNYYEGEFNPKILIEPDTLLFAWSGSRGTSFGPHIWKGETGVLNYHTWKVVSNKKVIKEFLYYSLRYITTKIENDSHGASALVHMQKSAMENYKIALPNLVEQEKLAAVLLTLDSKLVNENSKLDQLQFLKKGLMQSLLTGKICVKVDKAEVIQA